MKFKYLIFAGLLLSTSAFAIDEDFYIPYTDTYGYKYDPETGKFVKEDQTAQTTENSNTASQGADSNSVTQDARPSTTNPSLRPDTPESQETSQRNIKFLIITLISGMLVGAFVYFFRSNRNKA